jgi:hypothetical protein
MVSSCYRAACAVRLQFKILWQGYTQKLEKFTVSPTGTATDYNPSVFHRELKNNYGSVPQSPTASPTDYNPSVFHRELKKHYGSVPQSLTESPMMLPMYIIDGLTDGIPTSRSARMSDACPSCRSTNGFSDGSKSLAGFLKFFGALIN